MSGPTLALGLGDDPPQVHVGRGADVSDAFWLELIAEWGTAGVHPGHGVELRVELFLARLRWLAPACRRHGVSLKWAPELAQLLAAARSERHELDIALGEELALDPDGVLVRLHSTRFDLDRRTLRPFQLRDAGKLLSLLHGANFSVPGAGKTTTAYAVYEAERAARRVEQLLVVAPLSAFDAWQSEADSCFRDGQRPIVAAVADSVPADAEIALVNYHRLTPNYGTLAKWVRQKPTLVLLDEAHRMKRGWDGQWGSACLNLAFLAKRRDILTGTPAPQSAADLLALVDFLWPGQARRVVPGRRFEKSSTAGSWTHGRSSAGSPVRPHSQERAEFEIAENRRAAGRAGRNSSGQSMPPSATSTQERSNSRWESAFIWRGTATSSCTSWKPLRTLIS